MYQYKRSKGANPKERQHYPAILGYVYRNRFAVASQVQRRFADVLRSDRTARRHLAEMEDLGYIAVAPTRSTSPLWPKVYFVTARGLRKLRKSLAAKAKRATVSRVDRSLREGYSADHVLHEILTMEFLLALWQTVQARPDLELLTVQRRSLERHPAFRVQLDGRPARVKPDAMFMFRQIGGGMMTCFLELDRGTMSHEQLLVKYRRYMVWSESQLGQQFLLELYRRHGAPLGLRNPSTST